MLRTRDAVSIVQIEDGVKDRIVIRYIHDRSFGKDHLHGLLEVGLFLRSMEIVGHEEASTEKVVAQLLRLGLGQAPLPNLDGVEPGPVVDLIAIVKVHACSTDRASTRVKRLTAAAKLRSAFGKS